jgi:hypothetical protein
LNQRRASVGLSPIATARRYAPDRDAGDGATVVPARAA